MKFTKVAPVLLTRNLNASLDFWSQKLDFEVRRYGDLAAMIHRDEVTLMLIEAPADRELPLPNWRVQDKTNQVYIWVDDVDALYAQVQDRNVPIDFTLYDTPWGTREFGVQDLDDHDIAFGTVLKTDS